MRVFGFFALLVASIATAFPALGQERFALLIANFDYKAEVGPLKNTRRDIDLISRALRQIGFKDDHIIGEENVGADQLRRLVRQHTDRVKAAGPDAVSFVYYSGHGASAPLNAARHVRGKNFVIPTDVESTRRADFWERTVAIEEIGQTLEEASQAIHILIFDACRTELQLPERDMNRGFQPVASSDQVGMLFAFASAPNQPALDGIENAENGPYAIALAQEMVRPGIDHLHLFANVRTLVANSTFRRQIPWTRDGFLSLFYLGGRQQETSAAPTSRSDDKVCRPDAAQDAPLLQVIEWRPLTDSDRIQFVFTRRTVTYTAARTDAGSLEQVDVNVVHNPAQNSKVEIGRVGDRDVWYRYVRDRGSSAQRYVRSDEVEVKQRPKQE